MHAAILTGNRSSVLFFCYTISPSNSPRCPRDTSPVSRRCAATRTLQLGKKQRDVEGLHQCNTPTFPEDSDNTRPLWSEGGAFSVLIQFTRIRIH